MTNNYFIELNKGKKGARVGRCCVALNCVGRAAESFNGGIYDYRTDIYRGWSKTEWLTVLVQGLRRWGKDACFMRRTETTFSSHSIAPAPTLFYTLLIRKMKASRAKALIFAIKNCWIFIAFTFNSWSITRIRIHTRDFVFTVNTNSLYTADLYNFLLRI